ncbi:MAG: dinucleotide-utilizing enzyme [Microbacterium sp.]|jgi:hypothetical protein|uniref:dinucleotide-utilizing enzyme n=1 Tax=Microbacterium sp. TaxID=51671 RepID=UPI003F7D0A3A
MSTRPRLARSIPFWGLLVVSLATAAGGAFLLTSKVGSLTAVLTDNSATAVDVYVGQVIAIIGGILLATGIIGVLLTLAVAALSTLRPVPAVEVVEPIDWKAEADEVSAEPVAETAAEPVVEAAPAAESETAVTR